MNFERELTILEVDKEEIENKLTELGAQKIGEFLQRRLVYDFNPVDPNKWIRLRTNGTKTTLTIKEIVDKTKIDGTKELEIFVDDFDKTNEILEKLGYFSRNYQENFRTIYTLNGVEICIDTWPLIPTYAEIEGKTNEEVLVVLEMLNVGNLEVTTLDVVSIYQEKYGIDIKEIKNLMFEDGRVYSKGDMRK